MDPLSDICAGQHVLVRLPSDNLKIVELKTNGIISLGKFGAFRVNEILGHKLGTTFQIIYTGDEKDVVKGSNTLIGEVRVAEDRIRAASPSGCSSENNQDLINIGSQVQKMSMEEIEKMKRQALSGDEIISKMVESHGSFHQKTVHSQEKYLKRKKQKFAKFFTVEYLDSSSLLNFLIDKGDIMRVMDISQETLGMALNLANIKTNGTYLCMDETGGLLVYAMLERMFGGKNDLDSNGLIVVVHENEHPNLDLLKFSNYSEEFVQSHVKTISILDFFDPPMLSDVENAFTPLSSSEVAQLKSNKKGSYYRRLKWYKNQLTNIKVARETIFDGLIVGSTLHLPTLIPRLGEKVHGSRPIVCYSQYKETLLELSHSLYDDLNYLAPTLLETRCRPYQTVRGKLHPLMTMRGGGGYLMWCHKVIPADEPNIQQSGENQENEESSPNEPESEPEVKRMKL